MKKKRIATCIGISSLLLFTVLQALSWKTEDHKDSIVLEERLYFVEPDGDSLSWRELK